jgi:hypothetical protein
MFLGGCWIGELWSRIRYPGVRISGGYDLGHDYEKVEAEVLRCEKCGTFSVMTWNHSQTIDA